MADGITLEGGERLARTLTAAGRELANLTATNRKVAAGIAAAANPPRLTGALAASIVPTATATEAVVTAGVRYAPFVEARTGFLSAALTSREAASLDLYAEAVDTALTGVKGA